MSAPVVRYVVSHENSDSNNHHDAVGEGIGTRAGKRRPAGGGAALCHHRRTARDGGRRAARPLCLLERRERAARAGDAAGEGSRANAQAARADTRATRGARAVSRCEAYGRPEVTLDARRSPASWPMASLVNGATTRCTGDHGSRVGGELASPPRAAEARRLTPVQPTVSILRNGRRSGTPRFHAGNPGGTPPSLDPRSRSCSDPVRALNGLARPA